MLVDRIGHVSRCEALSRTVVIATLALAGLLYGGVHLTAWQTKIKKRTEEDMWNMSAITLAASGPLGVEVSPRGVEVIVYETIYHVEGCMMGPECGLSIVLMLIVLASAMLYHVARICLIFESVLNLAYLEGATCVVSNWSQ
jgi:hypothetical protein